MRPGDDQIERRLGRLDERRLFAHRDDFADAADVERRVDAGLAADLEAQVGAAERLEAGQLERQLVGAGGHVGQRVRAGAIGRRRAEEAGVLIAQRDGDAGQDGVAGIADDTLERGGGGLRARRQGMDSERGGGEREQSASVTNVTHGGGIIADVIRLHQCAPMRKCPRS